MKISRIDHMALTVTNLEKACSFYKKILFMEVITFGGGRKALAFGNQKINLHERGKELDPKADKPTPGSSDICFIT